MGPPRDGYRLALVCLLAVVGLQLAVYLPEALHDVPDFNDDVLHGALVEAAAGAIARGEDPTDPWLSAVVQGYPLAHHYQHLPHVVLGAIAALSEVPARILLRFSALILLALFPLSVAYSVWRVTDDRIAGTFAGVAAGLLSTNGLYGFDPSSYGWGGFGLTTQLWGMVLIGPAWASCWRAQYRNGGVVPAAAALAGLVLSHTVLGYVTAASGWAMVILGGRRGVLGRARTMAAISGLALVPTAYFVGPFFLDRAAMNRSVWEDAGKYDSYGARWVLGQLLDGRLFDAKIHGWRPPVLTALVAIGAVASAVRWRTHLIARPFLFLFVVWLAVYFGRPTWGGLLNVLPLGGDLHLHRMIAPVHLAGAALAGIGVASVWRWARVLTYERKVSGVVMVLSVLSLLPAAHQRFNLGTVRRNWAMSTQGAFAGDRGAIHRALEVVRARTRGRAYGGRGANWGRRYRIGAVPVYALLTEAGIDNVGYLYHALSLNADIEGYLDESRPAHFNLFNVQTVIAPDDHTLGAHAVEVGRAGRHRIYGVQTSGFFDLVRAAGPYAGTRDQWFEAARRWLHSQHVEAKRHPVFELSAREGVAPMSAAPGPLVGAPTVGTLVNEVARPGRYAVTARVESATHVLLKVTYHPRWEARVDGRVVHPVMMAPAFVGVPVSPGEHRVEVAYRPRPWRGPLAIGGWLAIAFAWALERRLRVVGRWWPR